MKDLDCLAIYEDAEFYDLEFRDRNHELPFYVQWAEQAGSPILEIACGTGRLTLPLAERGFDIVGIDVSAPMLERAREKSAKSNLPLTWLEQDCRNLEIDKSFKLIFAATNAIQHLHDFESIQSFFQRVREHLDPNGVFIIDVFQPNLQKLLRKSSETYLHKTLQGSDGSEIKVWASSEYDPALQILSFDLNYEKNGKVFTTKKVAMRCFFPEELLALCQTNELEVIQRFGDYDESPFTGSSPKQLLVCRRAD